MHPLDLIKTRFQSINILIKAMMGNQMLRIKSLNMKELSKALSRSIKTKASKVYTKVFMFHY